MTLETVGRMILFIDWIAVGALVVYAWLDLRQQTTDLGKVSGVTALILLCFVSYFIGRAFLGT